MPPIRVLELRSVRGTGGGPEKTILLGTARTDPQRFAITVCYLRDVRDPIFHIDGKAAALPVDYTEIVERHSFDPGIWPRLRRLVQERRIDIVHSHDYKTNLLAWLLMLTQGTIAMSTEHGWTGNTPRERYVYYPLDKRLVGMLPRVVAVSEDIRRELIRHGARPERVVTVLNGIDQTQFARDRTHETAARHELGLTGGEVVVGAVGRLEPQKRFDLLLDAVAALRTRYPALRLLLAGDGSLREALASRIAQLGLEDTCRLLGQRSDIAQLHHAFDVFVQSSDYEGTPNAVLEAMALETPVVATDAGGTAQLIEHGRDGLIVPAGRLDLLIAGMERMLADPMNARRMAISARRRVETDLSFDTRMARIEAIYEDLYRRRRPAGGAVAHART